MEVQYFKARTRKVKHATSQPLNNVLLDIDQSQVNMKINGHPLPFADMKLPGNYQSIYMMVRNKRQQFTKMASKYQLTSLQKDILSTDYNYVRKKEYMTQQKLQVSVERMRKKQSPMQSPTQSPKQTSITQFTSSKNIIHLLPKLHIKPISLDSPMYSGSTTYHHSMANTPRNSITNNPRLNRLLIKTISNFRESSIQQVDSQSQIYDRIMGTQVATCKHAIKINSISPTQQSPRPRQPARDRYNYELATHRTLF